MDKKTVQQLEASDSNLIVILLQEVVKTAS